MNIQENINRINEIINFISENSRFDKMNDERYRDCYVSDIMRMEIIGNFFKKVDENPNYHKDPPNYDKLMDDWDGYDDQIYIQNKLNEDTIIFYEGWVNSCWSAAYQKLEYKGMGKKEIIENIINKRFPRIAEEFNLTIEDYGYIKHNGFIMYVVLNVNE